MSKSTQKQLCLPPPLVPGHSFQRVEIDYAQVSASEERPRKVSTPRAGNGRQVTQEVLPGFRNTWKVHLPEDRKVWSGHLLSSSGEACRSLS